jgi:hypothetical protein
MSSKRNFLDIITSVRLSVTVCARCPLVVTEAAAEGIRRADGSSKAMNIVEATQQGVHCDAAYPKTANKRTYISFAKQRIHLISETTTFIIGRLFG